MASSAEERLAQARQFALERARQHRVEPYAEDVAQEAVLRLLNQDPQPDNVEAWLTRVVSNLVHDKRRRDLRRRPAMDAESSSLDSREEGSRRSGEPGLSSQVAERLRIDEALAGLSDRDRSLLAAHLEGVPNGQLADQFGLANARVAAVSLARIRRRVRERLIEQ